MSYDRSAITSVRIVHLDSDEEFDVAVTFEELNAFDDVERFDTGDERIIAALLDAVAEAKPEDVAVDARWGLDFRTTDDSSELVVALDALGAYGTIGDEPATFTPRLLDVLEANFSGGATGRNTA